MTEWSVSSPLLLCLPVAICFILHILVSTGLLVQTRPGFYRFFVFMASSGFFIIYLLLFNYYYTLATTSIRIDLPGQRVELQNQYGTVQIPKNSLEAVVVREKAGRPETVWIFSDLQTFYLDRSFTGFESFLSTLAKLVNLGPPLRQGEQTAYRLRPGSAGSSVVPDYFALGKNNNALQGHTMYFLPWLGAMPFLFYFIGQKAWAGQTRCFITIAVLYFLPLAGLSLFFRPSLPLAVFLFITPLYLSLLSALCLPERSE